MDEVRAPDAILPKTAVGSFLNKFIEKCVKEKPDKKEEKKKVGKIAKASSFSQIFKSILIIYFRLFLVTKRK